MYRTILKRKECRLWEDRAAKSKALKGKILGDLTRRTGLAEYKIFDKKRNVGIEKKWALLT